MLLWSRTQAASTGIMWLNSLLSPLKATPRVTFNGLLRYEDCRCVMSLLLNETHTHLGVGERNTSRPDAHIPSVNSQFIFGPIRHVCDVVTFFIFFNLVILSVVLLEFMDHFQMYDPFSRNHWSLFDCALGISYI